jgi:hypothetical protein
LMSDAPELEHSGISCCMPPQPALSRLPGQGAGQDLVRAAGLGSPATTGAGQPRDLRSRRRETMARTLNGAAVACSRQRRCESLNCSDVFAGQGLHHLFLNRSTASVRKIHFTLTPQPLDSHSVALSGQRRNGSVDPLPLPAVCHPSECGNELCAMILCNQNARRRGRR